MSCVIEGCKSHSGRTTRTEENSLSFHKFPKDEELRNEWIKRVNRPKWSCQNHSAICSKHFTLDSFVPKLPNDTQKGRRLKSDAVPTLYLPYYRDTSELTVTTHVTEDNDLVSPVKSESNDGEMITIKLEPAFNTAVVDPLEISTPPEPAIPLYVIKKQRSNTSSTLTCDNHEKTISRLQKKLQRVNKVSQRRLRKINTLKQQIHRMSKKNDDLCKILMNKMHQEYKSKNPMPILTLDAINQPSGNVCLVRATENAEPASLSVSHSHHINMDHDYEPSSEVHDGTLDGRSKGRLSLKKTTKTAACKKTKKRISSK